MRAKRLVKLTSKAGMLLKNRAWESGVGHSHRKRPDLEAGPEAPNHLVGDPQKRARKGKETQQVV